MGASGRGTDLLSGNSGVRGLKQCRISIFSDCYAKSSYIGKETLPSPIITLLLLYLHQYCTTCTVEKHMSLRAWQCCDCCENIKL